MLFNGDIKKINSSNEGALIVFVDDINGFIKKNQQFKHKSSV